MPQLPEGKDGMPEMRIKSRKSNIVILHTICHGIWRAISAGDWSSRLSSMDPINVWPSCRISLCDRFSRETPKID